MNYQRLYLLSIMSIGLIFAAPSVPALLKTRRYR